MAGARLERRWRRLWRVLERVFEGGRERRGRGTYRMCYLGDGKNLARVLRGRGRRRARGGEVRYAARVVREEGDNAVGSSGQRRKEDKEREKKRKK